jgi:glycosyltransferase involved in cell wall biosynthesis
MRVLVDGRVNGQDGIGRYTRGLTASLRLRHPDVDVMVLGPSGTPRYSRAEGEELLRAARACAADVVHVLDYRVPLTAPDVPLVVTIHDVMRLLDPRLCYTDAQFTARFGRLAFAELGALTAGLRRVAAWPVAARTECGVHEEFYGRMLVLAVTCADAIVTPTRAVADQLHAVSGDRRHVHVSPWGIDHAGTRQAASPPLDHVGRYLLYVGQARAHKGLDNLHTAWTHSDAARTGARLVCVGADFAPGGDAAQRLVQRLGAAALPIGLVDDDELGRLYRGAEALLHLAKHEGFGFTPLEALAAGTRVIASDILVLRETLGEHATFINPADHAAVASVISALLATPDRPIDREARQRWAARYSWRRHARDMVALYRKAVS